MYLCQPEAGVGGALGRRTGIFRKDEVSACVHEGDGRFPVKNEREMPLADV